MSKIDESYHKLLQHILDNGFKYEDPNRKGIYRYQVPSYTIKHDFTDGFPAITTKKLYWKGVVGELLWFLRGDTSIKYLLDNDINIWNKDAYNWYCKRYNTAPKTAEQDGFFTLDEFIKTIKSRDKGHPVLGDLGRVYGAQWRYFAGYRPKEYVDVPVDQISNLIKGLKESPMGTRHIVTAWNPAELGDMALPPCHWSFEILVEPNYKHKRVNEASNKKLHLPEYNFTLKWHQRSVDSFLGAPFNIASYALLAQIIGKMTNMVPKGIIGDLSNVHIYEPHLDAVKEQLSRNVNKYDKCKLEIWKRDKSFILKSNNLSLDQKLGALSIHNFKLQEYKSYPAIKAEMLAYNK